MTPDQIALVRQSFTKILPIKEAAAALFYDRLFAIDPSTRPLFRRDMAAQGTKLMAAIAMVVRSLDNLEPMLDGSVPSPAATSSTA
jgi:hemoglobin-like flavoprotein